MGHHTKQHGVQHVRFELIILLELLLFKFVYVYPYIAEPFLKKDFENN